RLLAAAGQKTDAIFHAAAVSDFGFGKVYTHDSNGKLIPITGKKISTRAGHLFAELVPTPKIIAKLRTAFPQTCIVGWKYEVDGERPDVLLKAEQQIHDNHSDGCVANGPAYGFGFGLVDATRRHQHLTDTDQLFAALEELALAKARTS
ncbi:MAG: phosphopantothenoylcysteine decarboxylase, partial [Limisphaerales bacterium]